jgi:hypothetical protein
MCPKSENETITVKIHKGNHHRIYSFSPSSDDWCTGKGTKMMMHLLFVIHHSAPSGDDTMIVMKYSHDEFLPPQRPGRRYLLVLTIE